MQIGLLHGLVELSHPRWLFDGLLFEISEQLSLFELVPFLLDEFLGGHQGLVVVHAILQLGLHQRLTLESEWVDLLLGLRFGRCDIFCRFGPGFGCKGLDTLL